MIGLPPRRACRGRTPSALIAANKPRGQGGEEDEAVSDEKKRRKRSTTKKKSKKKKMGAGDTALENKVAKTNAAEANVVTDFDLDLLGNFAL